MGRPAAGSWPALLGQPDEAIYLRQLARVVGMGLGAVQQEVRRLSEAGILLRIVRGHQVYYQANPECPIFNELRSLILKTAGVGDVLAKACRPLAARIRVALLFGSVVRGAERHGSDVDILVVGEVSFAEVVAAVGKTQLALGREVNPVVYPPEEFRANWPPAIISLPAS